MTGLKIVFLDYATLGDSPLALIESLGELEVFDVTGKDEIVKRAKEADVIITNKVVLGADTLESLPKLRLICIAATGVNNVDLDACKRLGITVKNVKGYSTQSVVQTLFSSLLCAVSNAQKFDRYVKSQEYADSKIFTCMDFSFNELCGKRIGIIGFGEIGQSVAKVAKAFGMEPVYCSTSGANDNKGYERVTLQTLLESCDIASVHCALTENTKNLINDNALSKLSKNAILINFARGGIVDEAALARALNEDRLAMYISDVFEKEPIERSSPLFSVSNQDKLFLTPHIAWASVEARERLVSAIAENIKGFFEISY